VSASPFPGEPPRPASRLPVVGVMGSGGEEHAARAEPLGKWLAEIGVHLLTGGGAGVMTAVGRGYHRAARRAGSVIGILPAAAGGREAARGYPNPWVEIAVYTHLPRSGREGEDPLSRNHVNVLSADVVVALPGGEGTASEVRLALRYRRPVVAYVDTRADIPGLPAQVPVASGIEAVRAFVIERLGRGDARAGAEGGPG